jgi:hypothetical protein
MINNIELSDLENEKDHPRERYTLESKMSLMFPPGKNTFYAKKIQKVLETSSKVA